MNRKNMTERITNVFTKAKDELLKAGVTPKNFEIIEKRLVRDKTKNSYIAGVLKVIPAIEAGHKEVLNVLDLLPQKTWDYYDLMKFTDMVEINLLKDARKQLLAAWRTLPIYRRSEHEKTIQKKKKGHKGK